MRNLSRGTSRRELFELVWENPISLIAKDFGLSDRGLAKLCARFDIPTPARGYWAKRAAGIPVENVPLTTREGGLDNPIVIRASTDDVHSENLQAGDESLVDQLYQKFADLTAGESAVRCAKPPRALHPLAAARIDEDRRFPKRTPWDPSSPNYRIKPRMRQFENWLITELENRGYRIEIAAGRGQSFIARYGVVAIGFSIIEKVYYEQKTISRPDREAMEPAPRRRVYTGKLSMQIRRSRKVRMVPYHWSDGVETLEAHLPEIIASIKIYTEVAMLDAEQRRRVQAVEDEEEQAQQVAIERINVAQKKVGALRSDAECWRSAQHIRAYVDAVRSAPSQLVRQMYGMSASEWCDWALREADQIDPLTRARS